MEVVSIERSTYEGTADELQQLRHKDEGDGK